MKHLILGNGNLGNALLKRFKQNEKDEVRMLSRSEGWEWPQGKNGLIEEVKNFKPDMIWNTVGAGSISEGKKFFGYQLLVHVDLPLFLITEFKDTKIVCFSTDYVRDDAPPIGNYGLSKFFMEQALTFSKQSNWRIVRVSNLVGMHKFDSTIIGKLHKLITSSKVILAHNEVRLTDCHKLADYLNHGYTDNFQSRERISYIAGSLVIDIISLYIQIMKASNTKIDQSISTFTDNERPLLSRKPDFDIGFDLETWLGKDY